MLLVLRSDAGDDEVERKMGRLGFLGQRTPPAPGPKRIADGSVHEVPGLRFWAEDAEVRDAAREFMNFVNLDRAGGRARTADGEPTM